MVMGDHPVRPGSNGRVGPMSEPFAHDDEGVRNPDEVKVPEGRAHRRLATLAHVAAQVALGADWQVDADLNWYPLDGGGPMAPDVMVLPAGTTAENATSYRQAEVGGPAPVAVVEVPSQSDDVPTFRTKVHRLVGLGVVVYVAHVVQPDVERHAPGEDGPRRWLGQPCPELGGLVFQVEDGQLVVWVPPGRVAADAAELVDSADARASEAEARASEAEARAARLAERLRAAGLDVEPA